MSQTLTLTLIYIENKGIPFLIRVKRGASGVEIHVKAISFVGQIGRPICSI